MRLSLEQFLQNHEITLDYIRNRVEAQIGLDAGDALFAGGSLAESFGHPKSDLDLYLLTHRAVSSVGERVVIECKSAPVDLELWPFSHVECLLESLAAMPAQAVRDPRDSLVFDKEDREFLHRLSIGITLAGEARLRSIAARVDRRSLARVLFDRACAQIGTAQADLVGMLELGDLDTSLYLIQMIAECALDCILAATGHTNPEEKWRLAKLSGLLGTNWDAELLGGRLLPDVVTAMRGLLYPGSVAPEATARRAHECVRLANRVIPWGQERFASARELTPYGTAPREGESRDGPVPCGGPEAGKLRIALNVHIRYEPEQYKIYPFDGGTVLSVNRLFAETLALYDGKTSREGIVTALKVLTDAPAAHLSAAIADLETLLIAEQMLTGPA